MPDKRRREFLRGFTALWSATPSLAPLQYKKSGPCRAAANITRPQIARVRSYFLLSQYYTFQIPARTLPSRTELFRL